MQDFSMPEGASVATFAGGCFWCLEGPFDQTAGVLFTEVGYTGGQKPDPTYEEVCAGGTGHAEAIRVGFDPDILSYEQLMYVFWRNIDPITRDGQFCDHGEQYRSEIFYHDPQQQAVAQSSIENLNQSGQFKDPVVTAITQASTWYPAEDYHQDYYRKNPVRYKFYRIACGRDNRLKQLWGD